MGTVMIIVVCLLLLCVFAGLSWGIYLAIKQRRCKHEEISVGWNANSGLIKVECSHCYKEKAFYMIDAEETHEVFNHKFVLRRYIEGNEMMIDAKSIKKGEEDGQNLE